MRRHKTDTLQSFDLLDLLQKPGKRNRIFQILSVGLICRLPENSHLSTRPASNLPYGVFTQNGSSHASAQFYFYPRLSLIIAKCVKNEKSYLLNSVNIKSGFLSSVMPTLHALINRSNGLPFRSVTFFMSEVPTILST